MGAGAGLGPRHHATSGKGQSSGGPYLDEQAFVGQGKRGVWRGCGRVGSMQPSCRALQTCISREKAEEEQCDEAAGRASGGAGWPCRYRHGRNKQTNI